METFFGAIGLWVGLNFGALAKASMWAGGAAMLVKLAWKRDESLWIFAGLAVLVLAFGFQVSRIASGLAFLYSENESLATAAAAAVLTASALAIAVVWQVRSRPVLAIGFTSLGIIAIGTAAPIAQRAAQRSPQPSSASDSIATVTRRASATLPLWRSEVDGFAAQFPATPSRVGAEAVGGGGRGYVSPFERISAASGVMVVPLEFTLDSASKRRFSVASHRSFLQSLAIPDDSTRLSWAPFGSGREVLEYENRFVHEGVAVIGRGFWLVDGRRIFRVYVTYPRELAESDAADVTQFLRTFVLLSPAPPVTGPR